MEVQLHAFSISVLDGGEWSASCPGRFTPEKIIPRTHWIGGWISRTACLDAVVKRKFPSSCRELNPYRPARSLVTMLNDLSQLLNYCKETLKFTGRKAPTLTICLKCLKPFDQLDHRFRIFLRSCVGLIKVARQSWIVAPRRKGGGGVVLVDSTVNS
jgi:hypothetical protein